MEHRAVMKRKAFLLNHNKVHLTKLKQFNTSCAGLQVELKQSCCFAPLNMCCGVTVLWAEEKTGPKPNPGLIDCSFYESVWIAFN